MVTTQEYTVINKTGKFECIILNHKVVINFVLILQNDKYPGKFNATCLTYTCKFVLEGSILQLVFSFLKKTAAFGILQKNSVDLRVWIRS